MGNYLHLSSEKRCNVIVPELPNSNSIKSHYEHGADDYLKHIISKAFRVVGVACVIC
jgi:hypothetical protein